MSTNDIAVQSLSHPDRWSILSRTLQERALAQLFTSLRSINVEPIAIKGWSIARYYPEGETRSSSDIDIAVRPDQFNLFNVTAEHLTGLPVSVDLHEGLRDRDTLGWEELFARSYTVELHNVPIRVLSEEDNLRITAAHWLIDGGVYKSRLWDIYYLVRNRKQDFDWQRCVDAAGPTRRSWVLAAIATARDYLELDVADLPPEVQDFELPAWYRKALEREWKLGPYLRIPISQCIGKPKVLMQQARRRFPPNLIAATTDTEGIIDDSPRLKHQVRSVLKKLLPASAGIYRRIVNRR